MQYICTLLIVFLSQTTYAQKKWIGIWDQITNKFISSYKISMDSLDIHKIHVAGSGFFLICIAEDEEDIEKKKKLFNADKHTYNFYFVDGYIWEGVSGYLKDGYTELPDGHWLGYYSTPTKHYSKWEKFVESGKIEGFVNSYDENKCIKQFTEYSLGLKNGFDVHYTQGAISEILYYQNGHFIETVSFDSKGHLSHSCQINRFKKHWNDKGVLVGYQEIDSNLAANGNWTEYYDNGIMKISGQLKQDKKYGTWYYYKINGALYKEEIWDNGSLIKEILR